MQHELIHILFRKIKQSNSKGFTLIELLVVVIIIGILSAVATPSLFRQVEKSRQTEAKVVLGNINRAQQAYRLEHGTFTTIANLEMTFSGNFYTYTNIGTPDAFGVVHIATAVATFENDLKDYSSAVCQTTTGSSRVVICEQNTADGATVPVPATVSAGIPACTTGTTPIF